MHAGLPLRTPLPASVESEIDSHGAKTVRSSARWEPEPLQPPEDTLPPATAVDDGASHDVKTVRTPGRSEPDQTGKHAGLPLRTPLPASVESEIDSHGAKAVRSPARWEPEQAQMPGTVLPPASVEDDLTSHEAKTVRSPGKWEPAQPAAPLESTLSPIEPVPSRPYGANIFDSITPTQTSPPGKHTTSPDSASGAGVDVHPLEAQSQELISRDITHLGAELADANLNNMVGSSDTGLEEASTTTAGPLDDQPQMPVVPAPEEDLLRETSAPEITEKPEPGPDALSITCQACGQPLRATSKFCPRCGSKV